MAGKLPDSESLAVESLEERGYLVRNDDDSLSLFSQPFEKFVRKTLG